MPLCAGRFPPSRRCRNRRARSTSCSASAQQIGSSTQSMNLRELFDTSVRLGIAQDVRGGAPIQAQLARRRQEYDALPDWQKRYYDQERFVNPFGDVRLAYSPRPPEEIELDTIVL